MAVGVVGLLSLLDLVKSPGILDGPVKAVGLHIFTLVWAVMSFGVLVWQRQVGLLWQFSRYVIAILPAVLFTAGIFSLAASSRSSSIRHAPSRREYSV